VTELVVLTLYSQSITQTYMCVIRGPGKESMNMLNAGPLHDQVQKHMEKVIATPEILMGPSATYKTGIMDGQEWHNSGAVKAALEMAPNLPHLKTALIEFFGGALETRKQFTSEFKEGGHIDILSAEEHELAWMPPNDTS
jgi:hypothetical protein